MLMISIINFLFLLKILATAFVNTVVQNRWTALQQFIFLLAMVIIEIGLLILQSILKSYFKMPFLKFEQKFQEFYLIW